MRINASSVTAELKKTFSDIHKEEITHNRDCCVSSVYFRYFEEINSVYVIAMLSLCIRPANF
jgi:hypothetical protein